MYDPDRERSWLQCVRAGNNRLTSLVCWFAEGRQELSQTSEIESGASASMRSGG